MSKREGPRPLPDGFVPSVFRGTRYPLEALGFLRHHRLWHLALIPTIVNAILYIALVIITIWLVWPWLDGLEQALTPESQEGVINSVLGWLGKALAVVLRILIPLALTLFNAFVLVLIGQAVASPFLDVLSEKVETIVLGTEPAPTSVARVVRSIVVAIADIVWTVVFFLVVNIPLLLINLLPVIGSAANAVLTFCFSAMLLTQEFGGLPLTRQLVSYPARWKVVWGNKGLSIGFGATTMLLLFVPPLSLVLLPLASVGGTLLYCDLRAAGRVNIPGIQDRYAEKPSAEKPAE